MVNLSDKPLDIAAAAAVGYSLSTGVLEVRCICGALWFCLGSVALAVSEDP